MMTHHHFLLSEYMKCPIPLPPTPVEILGVFVVAILAVGVGLLFACLFNFWINRDIFHSNRTDCEKLDMYLDRKLEEQYLPLSGVFRRK